MHFIMLRHGAETWHKSREKQPEGYTYGQLLEDATLKVEGYLEANLPRNTQIL